MLTVHIGRSHIKMSVCSTAVGLLATMAALHIAITIVLGVLVVFVLHIRNRGKIMKHQQQIAKTTRALVAAGRTISPSDPPSDLKEESEEIDKLHLETSSEAVTQEKETLGELENKETLRENFTNPWIGRTDNISPDHDNSEVVLRKVSLDKPDPLRRIGTPIMRTGSPLVRTGSPLVRTSSPIDDMRRKARASIISVASNLSSRFRKSVDLNEEEVAKLVSMSTIIDSSDSNSEEGILAISGDDKVDDDRDIDVASGDDNTSDAGEQSWTVGGSNMQLKIDFPDWEASESRC